MRAVSPIVQPTEPAAAEQKAPDKKIDVIISQPQNENTEDLMPLDMYEQEKGHPYTVDSLGIFFWDALSPEVDVHNVLPTVKKIEKYVADEIQDNRLNYTVGSYKEVMQRIKDALEMSDNEMIESKVERVKMYVNLMNKQKARRKKDSQLSRVAVRLKTLFKG